MIRRADVFVTWLLAGLGLMMLTIPPAAATQAAPRGSDAPIPIAFPRDDGAHDSRIEWWYFTGHLFAENGARYGFEYVVFRARQGGLEGYVSHLAVTDNARGTFRYDQRMLPARGVVGSAAALDLRLNGWTMRGDDGEFALAADLPGYRLGLTVAAIKPATLHDGDGYIDYGNGTASYYYSWTRMQANGTFDVDGDVVPVRGEAWMDHQWGDFATYRDGGWDWFAIQLDDGTDVMLYVIRDAAGEPLRVDGSLVAGNGELTALGAEDFTVRPLGTWTSGATGTTYPARWTIEIPSASLSMTLTPTLPDQELDTRATTGVIYWEGEALAAARREGEPVSGLAYVELTGYAPYVPVDLGRTVATPVS